MCYYEGFCICPLTSKEALLSECRFDSFNIHFLKVPVHKIQFCFVICYGICKPQFSHTDANAAVLLHCIMLMQRHPFAVELVLKILFEKSPATCAADSVWEISSNLCCRFCVRNLQQLVLKILFEKSSSNLCWRLFEKSPAACAEDSVWEISSNLCWRFCLRNLQQLVLQILFEKSPSCQPFHLSVSYLLCLLCVLSQCTYPATQSISVYLSDVLLCGELG